MTIHVPEHFLVSLQLPDGTQLTLDGRVAKMIEWLVEQRGRIETMPFGHVHFDVSPTSFQPEIKRTFPRVQAQPSVEP